MKTKRFLGFFWTKSKNVKSWQKYFLGVSFSKIAEVWDSSRSVLQIRVGLIWRHFGVTFTV